MTPSVNAVEVSDFKCGLDSCSCGSAIEHCPTKFPAAVIVPGFLQRIGSAVEPETKLWPARPFSPGPGARKPCEAVPRSANSGSGVNLKPIFGLALPPDWL